MYENERLMLRWDDFDVRHEQVRVQYTETRV